ncbi:hypothetical protein NDI34_17895 [Trichocoleus sp. DQ-U1]
MSEKTQEVLKLAACIGNQFTLEALSIVNKQSLINTADDLWEALQLTGLSPREDFFSWLLVRETISIERTLTTTSTTGTGSAALDLAAIVKASIAI